MRSATNRRLAATSEANKPDGGYLLARMGVTPTQLVRAVWMKVSHGAEAFDQIVAVLAQEPAAVSVAESAGQEGFETDPFEERLVAFYRDSGFDYAGYSSPTDDEWEELLMEDWAERETGGLVPYAQ